MSNTREEFFAHSAKNGFPAQSYKQHIDEVFRLATGFAQKAAKYSVNCAELLLQTSGMSALFHDLGKLDEYNQGVLSGKCFENSLPLNHVDAGTAFLLKGGSLAKTLAAFAVFSHHIGLPDIFSQPTENPSAPFRDKDKSVRGRVDQELSQYLEIHNSLIKANVGSFQGAMKGDTTLFLRILLSCLVDADHTNTAEHYGKNCPKEVQLRPSERLCKLDSYVERLGGKDSSRGQLRSMMYTALRNFDNREGIAACDSPVGSGKTTALMAHLLNQAKNRGLRRIFVILPFTNLIEQSVKVYREALVLDGENPEEVVAELHHRADFESQALRHLSSLWKAPIVVTTAVSFFETLASNRPATLRKLHELVGSAVFVDEAHAALPAKFLPLAWHWMKAYADEWSCYWLLASGSLNKFWQIKSLANPEDISQKQVEIRNVPIIVPEELRSCLSTFEASRIEYKSLFDPLSLLEFANLLKSTCGPQIVVVNTIQSAAVLANFLAKKYGRDSVEHLSTALLPKDRQNTLSRVIKRLKNPKDSNWTLVATSCVEAGMDFSFRNGFREMASVTSLLQLAGRVNRNGEYDDSRVYSFSFILQDGLQQNPGLRESAEVLRDLLMQNVCVEPSITTKAIERELKIYGLDKVSSQLVKYERLKKFPAVEQGFKVIENETAVVVVEKSILEKINGGDLNWKELQQNSLQIGISKLKAWNVCQSDIGEIYFWNRKYDSFLGYMAGVLDTEKED